MARINFDWVLSLGDTDKMGGRNSTLKEQVGVIEKTGKEVSAHPLSRSATFSLF